jgi:hypothetical protein
MNRPGALVLDRKLRIPQQWRKRKAHQRGPAVALECGCAPAENKSGHVKTDGYLGRCYLKARHGDAANAILSAVGYNLRLVLAWLRIVLHLILIALRQAFTCVSEFKSAS